MAFILDWYGGNRSKEDIKGTNYAYGQEIPEEEVIKAAGEIFTAGLNIMVKHREEGGTLIAVSSSGFGQRG
jgi:hypothetical protein